MKNNRKELTTRNDDDNDKNLLPSLLRMLALALALALADTITITIIIVIVNFTPHRIKLISSPYFYYEKEKVFVE